MDLKKIKEQHEFTSLRLETNQFFSVRCVSLPKGFCLTLEGNDKRKKCYDF